MAVEYRKGYSVNLLVWGTGNMAKTILDKGIWGNIVGFVESNPRVSLFMGKPAYICSGRERTA